MDKERIRNILRTIVHPELECNIVDAGMVAQIEERDNGVEITLQFRKAKDPFEKQIRTSVETAVSSIFPYKKVWVEVRESDMEGRKKAQNAKIDEMKEHSTLRSVKKIIAVASGKGGVGKSTVTSNLALALVGKGYSVGILDADIYGPSQAKMFGVEGYLPDVERTDEGEFIVPASNHGVKLISIAMFIRPEDALLWRGAMANSALRQLIHQTAWGELDYLLIDLPPGTGDIHLSIFQEMKVSGAIIVSTPQQVAVADVVRGVEMFRNPSINIPIIGIVENMAWFSPAELPGSRYYIFGKDGARKYAEKVGVYLLGEVPLIMSIMEGGDSGKPAFASCQEVREVYEHIAEKVVEKCLITCS